MKKLLLIIILLNCCVAFSQQNYSVVKGNVGEKNVNISIINTSFGVSSDDKGDFMMALPKTEKQVGLLFSCIGYEDALVSVIPNSDTIYLNFKMKETYYMLDAVGVSVDKIKRYSEPNYVMFDFEIYDDKVFILQRKDNTLKECRILVQDLWLDPIDTINVPNHIEPEKIIVDCTESCQLTWYHTKDNHLDVIDNTLYYFDHFNGKIQQYDEGMNLLHECEIVYPTEEDFWRYKIYKDKAFGKFYTIFGTAVNEINTNTGKTKSVANADSWISEKIIIYKGNLYAVTKKKNALKEFESYIERIEL